MASFLTYPQYGFPAKTIHLGNGMRFKLPLRKNPKQVDLLISQSLCETVFLNLIEAKGDGVPLVFGSARATPLMQWYRWLDPKRIASKLVTVF